MNRPEEADYDMSGETDYIARFMGAGGLALGVAAIGMFVAHNINHADSTHTQPAGEHQTLSPEEIKDMQYGVCTNENILRTAVGANPLADLEGCLEEWSEWRANNAGGLLGE